MSATPAPLPGGDGYCSRHVVCPVGCLYQRVRAQADDLMALADAVGVTTGPAPQHPYVRQFLTDDVLDDVVSAWALAYAQPDCATCSDTGLVDAVCWWTKRPVVITCLDCSRGDDR